MTGDDAVTLPFDDLLGWYPTRIDPGQEPGGVVVMIWRWRDRRPLAERHLGAGSAIEEMAEADQLATWPDAFIADSRHHRHQGGGPDRYRAVVLGGYDGDTGEQLSLGVVTDDPTLIAALRL